MAQIRRHERVEHLQHPWENEQETYDFSKGGAGMYLDRCLPEGTTVTLKLTVGKLSASAKAKVAHSSIFGKRYRTGFEFVDVHGDTAAILREMSNQYSRGVPVKIEPQ